MYEIVKGKNEMDNEWADIRVTIKHAKTHLDTDPHLANFMLRSHPFLVECGLSDLSWSMHQEGCTKNDVEFLIERIEHYLSTGDRERIKE